MVNFLKAIKKSTITPCIFKNLTSFPCPSCGATRGLLEILAGNFLSGLLINPISWIYVVGMLVLPVWILLAFLNNSDSLFRFYLKFEYFVKQKLIACSAVILVVANWMWNFYKFY